eukprot:GHVN01065889.1.p1 GENE.GHVN01065889.1~~GHVN01065889.1.p1  ORF type:complete len:3455 (-),score=473.94 GHVN01065889.1:28-10392(-)
MGGKSGRPTRKGMRTKTTPFEEILNMTFQGQDIMRHAALAANQELANELRIENALLESTEGGLGFYPRRPVMKGEDGEQLQEEVNLPLWQTEVFIAEPEAEEIIEKYHVDGYGCPVGAMGSNPDHIKVVMSWLPPMKNLEIECTLSHARVVVAWEVIDELLSWASDFMDTLSPMPQSPYTTVGADNFTLSDLPQPRQSSNVNEQVTTTGIDPWSIPIMKLHLKLHLFELWIPCEPLRGPCAVPYSLTTAVKTAATSFQQLERGGKPRSPTRLKKSTTAVSSKGWVSNESKAARHWGMLSDYVLGKNEIHQQQKPLVLALKFGSAFGLNMYRCDPANDPYYHAVQFDKNQKAMSADNHQDLSRPAKQARTSDSTKGKPTKQASPVTETQNENTQSPTGGKRKRPSETSGRVGDEVVEALSERLDLAARVVHSKSMGWLPARLEVKAHLTEITAAMVVPQPSWSNLQCQVDWSQLAASNPLVEPFRINISAGVALPSSVGLAERNYGVSFDCSRVSGRLAHTKHNFHNVIESLRTRVATTAHIIDVNAMKNTNVQRQQQQRQISQQKILTLKLQEMVTDEVDFLRAINKYNEGVRLQVVVDPLLVNLECKTAIHLLQLMSILNGLGQYLSDKAELQEQAREADNLLGVDQLGFDEHGAVRLTGDLDSPQMGDDEIFDSLPLTDPPPQAGGRRGTTSKMPKPLAHEHEPLAPKTPGLAPDEEPVVTSIAVKAIAKAFPPPEEANKNLAESVAVTVGVKVELVRVSLLDDQNAQEWCRLLVCIDEVHVNALLRPIANRTYYNSDDQLALSTMGKLPQGGGGDKGSKAQKEAGQAKDSKNPKDESESKSGAVYQTYGNRPEKTKKKRHMAEAEFVKGYHLGDGKDMAYAPATVLTQKLSIQGSNIAGVGDDKGGGGYSYGVAEETFPEPSVWAEVVVTIKLFVQHFDRSEVMLSTTVEPTEFIVSLNKQEPRAPTHLFVDGSWINLNFSVGLLDALITYVYSLIGSLSLKRHELRLDSLRPTAYKAHKMDGDGRSSKSITRSSSANKLPSRDNSGTEPMGSRDEALAGVSKVLYCGYTAEVHDNYVFYLRPTERLDVLMCLWQGLDPSLVPSSLEAKTEDFLHPQAELAGDNLITSKKKSKSNSTKKSSKKAALSLAIAAAQQKEKLDAGNSSQLYNLLGQTIFVHIFPQKQKKAKESQPSQRFSTRYSSAAEQLPLQGRLLQVVEPGRSAVLPVDEQGRVMRFEVRLQLLNMQYSIPSAALRIGHVGIEYIRVKLQSSEEPDWGIIKKDLDFEVHGVTVQSNIHVEGSTSAMGSKGAIESAPSEKGVTTSADKKYKDPRERGTDATDPYCTAAEFMKKRKRDWDPEMNPVARDHVCIVARTAIRTSGTSKSQAVFLSSPLAIRNSTGVKLLTFPTAPGPMYEVSVSKQYGETLKHYWDTPVPQEGEEESPAPSVSLPQLNVCEGKALRFESGSTFGTKTYLHNCPLKPGMEYLPLPQKGPVVTVPLHWLVLRNTALWVVNADKIAPSSRQHAREIAMSEAADFLIDSDTLDSVMEYFPGQRTDGLRLEPRMCKMANFLGDPMELMWAKGGDPHEYNADERMGSIELPATMESGVENKSQCAATDTMGGQAPTDTRGSQADRSQTEVSKVESEHSELLVPVQKIAVSSSVVCVKPKTVRIGASTVKKGGAPFLLEINLEHCLEISNRLPRPIVIRKLQALAKTTVSNIPSHPIDMPIAKDTHRSMGSVAQSEATQRTHDTGDQGFATRLSGLVGSIGTEDTGSVSRLVGQDQTPIDLATSSLIKVEAGADLSFPHDPETIIIIFDEYESHPVGLNYRNDMNELKPVTLKLKIEDELPWHLIDNPSFADQEIGSELGTESLDYSSINEGLATVKREDSETTEELATRTWQEVPDEIKLQLEVTASLTIKEFSQAKRVVPGNYVRSVTVYAEYWAVNRLEFPLKLRRRDESHHSVLQPHTRTVVSSALATKPVLLHARATDVSASIPYRVPPKAYDFMNVSKAFARSGEVSSDKFEFDSLPSYSMTLSSKDPDVRLSYALTKTTAPPPFMRTSIIEVVPRIVIINDRSIALWIREAPTGKFDEGTPLRLNPQVSFEFHPQSGKKGAKVRLKLSGLLKPSNWAPDSDNLGDVEDFDDVDYAGQEPVVETKKKKNSKNKDPEDWSSPLPVSDSRVLQVRHPSESTHKIDPSPFSVSELEVTQVNGLRFIRFVDPAIPDYRILNRSMMEVFYGQLSRNEYEKLSPTSDVLLSSDGKAKMGIDDCAIPFSWYDPNAPKKLEFWLTDHTMSSLHRQVLENRQRRDRSTKIGGRDSFEIPEILREKQQISVLNEMMETVRVKYATVFDVEAQFKIWKKKKTKMDSPVHALASEGPKNSKNGKNEAKDMHYDVVVTLTQVETNDDTELTILPASEVKVTLRLQVIRGTRWISVMHATINRHLRRGSRESGPTTEINKDTQAKDDVASLYASSVGIKNISLEEMEDEANSPSKGESQTVANEDMRIKMALKGVGISVVDATPSEILYVSVRNINLKYDQLGDEETIAARIGWIQIDSHTKGKYYPTVLRPITDGLSARAGGAGGGRKAEMAFGIKLCRKVFRNEQSVAFRGFMELPLLSVRLQPLSLNVDSTVVIGMLLILDDMLTTLNIDLMEKTVALINESEQNPNSEAAREMLGPPITLLSGLSSDQQVSKVMITTLDIGGLAFVVNVKTGGGKSNWIAGTAEKRLGDRKSEDPFEEDAGPKTEVIQAIQSTLQFRAAISDACLVFARRCEKDICGPVEQLVNEYVGDYVGQSVRQFHKVLTAFDLLGNPAMFYKHIQTGATRSSSEIKGGCSKCCTCPMGPCLCAVGCCRGICYCAQYCTIGICDFLQRCFGSWYNICDMISNNSDKYSIAPDLIQQGSMTDQPTDCVEGLWMGIKIGTTNLGLSLGNICCKPFKGATIHVRAIPDNTEDVSNKKAKAGAQGFCIGCASGLSSIAGIPASALVCGQMSTGGIVNQLEAVPMLHPLRPQRPLSIGAFKLDCFNLPWAHSTLFTDKLSTQASNVLFAVSLDDEVAKGHGWRFWRKWKAGSGEDQAHNIPDRLLGVGESKVGLFTKQEMQWYCGLSDIIQTKVIKMPTSQQDTNPPNHSPSDEYFLFEITYIVRSKFHLDALERMARSSLGKFSKHTRDKKKMEETAAMSAAAPPLDVTRGISRAPTSAPTISGSNVDTPLPAQTSSVSANGSPILSVAQPPLTPSPSANTGVLRPADSGTGSGMSDSESEQPSPREEGGPGASFHGAASVPTQEEGSMETIQLANVEAPELSKPKDSMKMLPRRATIETQAAAPIKVVEKNSVYVKSGFRFVTRQKVQVEFGRDPAEKEGKSAKSKKGLAKTKTVEPTVVASHKTGRVSNDQRHSKISSIAPTEVPFQDVVRREVFKVDTEKKAMAVFSILNTVVTLDILNYEFRKR